MNVPSDAPVAPKSNRWKLVLIAIVALLAGLSLIVVVQPSQFTVTRTATIDARPEHVFPLINNFHQWENWSPWAKLDPNAKATFSGPREGKDAKFAWDGTAEVGTGAMTITDSDPNHRIVIQLDFEKPFKCTNITEFHLEPKGDSTQVTWTMVGENNFIAKAMGLLMDMDTMVGSQFEEGLSNIKSLAEKNAAGSPPEIPQRGDATSSETSTEPSPARP